MGKWFFILRVVMVAVLMAAFFIAPVLARRRVRMESGQRTLRFSLPLPADFARRNNLTPLPDIESVYVSGLFARWRSDNPVFKMEPDAYRRTWSINIPFPRGKTQYKFVLRIKGRPNPVWVQDISNPRTVDDGFGGLNSEMLVGSWPAPDSLAFFFGSAAAAIAFYTLLSLALRALGRFRFSSTQRALLIFCLIMIIAGLTAGAFSVDAQRRLARQAYLELSDMICLSLEGQGYDFSPISDSEGREKAHRAFDAFFRQARLRSNPGGPTGIFSSVSHVLIFSPQGRVSAIGDRSEMPLSISNRSDPFVLNSSYADSMFKDALREMAEEGPLPMEGRYGISPAEHWPESAVYAASARLLGFNIALLPVVKDLKTVCYIGLVINPQVYGSQIGASILVYSLIFSFLILCCLFLFLYKPTVAEVNPSLLFEFCSRHGLTPREKEIIEELVAGRDYQSIADKNFISLKTVKTHIHNIYRKAEVGNRLELTEAIRQRK